MHWILIIGGISVKNPSVGGPSVMIIANETVTFRDTEHPFTLQ